MVITESKDFDQNSQKVKLSHKIVKYQSKM